VTANLESAVTSCGGLRAEVLHTNRWGCFYLWQVSLEVLCKKRYAELYRTQKDKKDIAILMQGCVRRQVKRTPGRSTSPTIFMTNLLLPSFNIYLGKCAYVQQYRQTEEVHEIKRKSSYS